MFISIYTVKTKMVGIQSNCLFPRNTDLYKNTWGFSFLKKNQICVAELPVLIDEENKKDLSKTERLPVSSF